MEVSGNNVRDAVLWAASFLTKKGVENARLDAELLMAHALGRDRAYVLASLGEVLPEDIFQEFRGLVDKRGERQPLQYLTGKQEFMSLPFLVEEGVLIPRGDTEVLVEAVLETGIPFENILDVGTGSGIIALTLANYIKDSRVTAVDVSSRALAVAEKNAAALGVSGRVTFIEADVFEWFPEGSFDLVVSNPPYIPTGEIPILQPEVKFEPREALDGGEDGLKFYRLLASLARAVLKPGGMLALEIGWDQGEAVSEIAAAAGFVNVEVVRDYGDRDRVIICRKGLVWDGA